VYGVASDAGSAARVGHEASARGAEIRN
jgi:hypothetical protein